ncbi:hypothetical protein TRIUR3_20801 [Triticum urartu]|uniref:Uncharacterized protein n=1 Tax=Triticum urartu TaxID=4572 RepID=M7YK47_TRIUA|nr:hypothetical protein TRIUR3_20801 [Triticum urartu]
MAPSSSSPAGEAWAAETAGSVRPSRYRSFTLKVRPGVLASILSHCHVEDIPTKQHMLVPSFVGGGRKRIHPLPYADSSLPWSFHVAEDGPLLCLEFQIQISPAPARWIVLMNTPISAFKGKGHTQVSQETELIATEDPKNNLPDHTNFKRISSMFCLLIKRNSPLEGCFAEKSFSALLRHSNGLAIGSEDRQLSTLLGVHQPSVEHLDDNKEVLVH